MQDDKVFVSLTHEPLESMKVMDLVRSHEAGAIVLFAGTTRNNFAGNHEASLELTPKARK
jgi:molybdopterin synthase catalytic subunit